MSEAADTLHPAIVLIEPQLGENIGMVARAMWNFGLTDLRLVNPRDGWPNPAAGPAASGADIVLDRARVYDSFAAAVADCNRVYVTAMVLRRMIKNVATPAGAVTEMLALAAQGARSALVFGPERTGLSTDDVARGEVLITIPTNPAFGSLNLAQAVIVILYEWYSQRDTTPPMRLDGDYDGPAPRASLDGLIDYVIGELDKRGYFYPNHRSASMQRTLRNIFERPGFTDQEVRTLRGALRNLVIPRPRVAGQISDEPVSDGPVSGDADPDPAPRTGWPAPPPRANRRG
jgi:tRNA/rRNA methyltransferase